MELYFLRHGVADWPEWDPAHDGERPLTSSGAVKMKAEARRMQQLGLKFDLILTSPLKRARQTAEIVARRLGVELVEEPGLAPGFSATMAAEIVARYPAADALLLVGHEPDFSHTIASLIGGRARVVMKKGSLARLSVELKPSGTLGGSLVWLLPPKLLVVE